MIGYPLVHLEKVACGAFSDSGFVAAGKRRDFCRLRVELYGLTDGTIQVFRQIPCRKRKNPRLFKAWGKNADFR
jgi:hypothetical protein